MMPVRAVPLPQSIGFQLLKHIFGIYCIAAVTVFSMQAWLEYEQAENRVIQSMQSHKELVVEGLANAAWHLDMPLLDTLLNGVLSQSSITSIGVYDEVGRLVLSAGKTDLDTAVVPLSVRGQQHKGIISGTNWHELHFDLFDPNKLSSDPIGSAIFYTDKNVVIAAIKPTVTSLIIAAVIKTLILWIVFIYFGRKLLSKPINRLTSVVKDISKSSAVGQRLKIDQAQNELEIFEQVVLDMEGKLSTAMTELRDKNEKLSKINYQLLSAAEQSPTLTILLSLQHSVLYATTSISELTGYHRGEAQMFFDGYLKKLVPEHQNWLKNCGENCEGAACDRWTQEIEINHKEGYPVFLNVTFMPLCSEEGTVNSILCTVNDISLQKRLENALVQKNQEQQQTIKNLELTQKQLVQSEKMASVGQLAAGVAHEINNPVGFVMSNTRVLRENYDNLLTLIHTYDKALEQCPDKTAEVAACKQNIDYQYICEDTPELLNDNEDGLSRIKRIVGDLMGFSHQGDTDFTLSDLRDSLESTLNVAWHELKYKAEIVKEYAEIPEIECMPSQLNQVFINLMVNAVHAMDEKGTLTLRTYPRDDQVIVEIEDTGSGIEPENLNKLFDPFFTTKPIGQGTGLGLSVSYGIIQAHHGSIEVDSKVGEGTCFKIALPVKQPV